MGEPDQNFLSRWSRRKALVRQGLEPAVPAPDLASPPAAAEPAPVPDAAPDSPPALPQVPEARTEVPRPTLADVQALTQESDFSRFVARDVDPEVKNLAMKKLFADPHYNVMDGLDTYIDDYNTPDPIPAAMFKQLVQARMLGLLDDELEDQVPAAEAGAQAAAAGKPAEPEEDQPAAQAEAEAASTPDAEMAAAPPEAPAVAAAPEGAGGRAWESNPPGTA